MSPSLGKGWSREKGTGNASPLGFESAPCAGRAAGKISSLRGHSSSQINCTAQDVKKDLGFMNVG